MSIEFDSIGENNQAINSASSVTIDIHDNFGECPICCEHFSSNRMKLLSCCSVKICSDCFVHHCVTIINQAKSRIECPSCSNEIESMSILNHQGIPLPLRERYQQILAQHLFDNKQAHVKLCPNCNLITFLDEKDSRMKSSGSKNPTDEHWIRCEQCERDWCWPCYAMSHPGVSCRSFKKNQLDLEYWAKNYQEGKPNQRNAQRCPKCSIFIEKIDGCDHMMCTKCEAKFCYRCGSRMRLPTYIGHDSKYSIFGCKYRLWPDRPCLRWFVRISILLLIILLLPIVLVILIALVVISLPLVVIAAIFVLPVFIFIKCKK